MENARYHGSQVDGINQQTVYKQTFLEKGDPVLDLVDNDQDSDSVPHCDDGLTYVARLNQLINNQKLPYA